MRFTDKVAIVTGAGNGIGLAIAQAFAAEGAKVVIADINGAAGERAATKLGDAALAVQTDVADEASVVRMVKAATDRYGKVDILVNNAGVVAHKLLLEMDRDTWDRQIDVQLTGPFLVSKHVARHMIDRGVRGRIVNISSVSALMGRVKGGAHCASKAGLTLLTKVLAMELGQYGITVNAVAPGLVETAAQKEEMNLSSEYQNRYLQELPTGRLGQPSDIANAVLFLSSDASEWISGQLYVVDGGLMAGHLSFQGVHDFTMLHGTGTGQ
ncbi:MAG TPA: 3-oxoacyl-ACP reductase family protein [Kouleothrix sp.]|uniref:SDR family NAD(P)-dependent oxidoreductase n=1 Tax=Kouleothrix sp. TaxID=2779161 RepID=UPI002C032D12|nr:3-oxoacyl-ACP reductase family protein [Kouleothrix sp.]